MIFYITCESILICLTEPCVLENLEQAKILSVRYNKTLISGSVATAHDQDRRNVFLKRDNKTETETTESDQWVFNKIDGPNRRYRIKNLQTNEYLYASADGDEEDNDPFDFRHIVRRRVFTSMNLTTTPDSGPQTDWEINCSPEGSPNGYTIKNLQYGEYLYSAADEWAFDKGRRSVFTWKNYYTLGIEGIWKFQGISTTNGQSST